MKALINAAGAWWNSISVREQRLFSICLVVVALACIYWGIVQPMQQRAEQAQARISSEKQLLEWVANKANRITALRGSGGSAVSDAPLNQIVTSSGRRYKVELIRMQPRNESLQVWIKPIPFNQLINWLAYLKEKQGVDVEFLDLSATDVSGVVDVKRLQLKRGI